MHLSPDEIIFWQWWFIKLNATIVFTWALMLIMAVGSKLITRRLVSGHKRSRWQNLLEIIVTAIEQQIVGRHQPVADVVREDAVGLAGPGDCRREVGVPPRVIDVDRHPHLLAQCVA